MGVSRLTEAELARLVCQHFREAHHEVYQEVQLRTGGPRADIVTTLGPVVWVIEVKKSLSLSVLAQVMHWRGFAHRVSVAIPRPKNRSRGRSYAERCMRRDGIGMIQVSSFDVLHALDAALFRKPPLVGLLRKNLCEEHKWYAEAGNAACKFWSPFKRTRNALLDIAVKQPGIKFKQALDQLDHHYATDKSARASLWYYIDTGVIDEVELRRDGKQLRLYPSKAGQGLLGL